MPPTVPSGETAVLAAVQALPVGVAIADRRGILMWANAAYAQLTDCEPDELIGQSTADFPLDDLLRAEPDSEPGSEPWRLQTVCRRKTGESRTVELGVTPLRTAAGEVTGFWIVKRDTTGRQTEAGLPNPVDANLAALIESTHDLIWAVDLDFRLLTFNSALRDNIERNTGIRVTIGMRPADMMPPARAALWPPMYRRALTEGPFRVGYSLLDGTTLELAFNPILHDGKATGVSVFGKDITERKTAERVLHVAETNYRDIFEGALEGIFRTTLQGRGLAANPAMAAMLGYDSPDEALSAITNTADQVWMDPADRSRCVQAVNEHGSVHGYECQLKRKDGTALWAAISMRMVRGTGEQEAYFEGFIEDISKRKRVEESLQQSEEKFAKMFRYNPAIMALTDLSAGGRIVDVNQTFEDATGYLRESAVGRTGSELGLWVDSREYREALTHFQNTGRLSNSERRFSIKSGDIRTGLMSAERIELGGRPYGLWATIDITDRKQAEASLQAQRDRFRRIVENTDAGYFRIGLDGCYEDVNPAWLRMHGFTGREEVIGLHSSAVQVAEDAAQAAEVVEALIRGERVIRGDFSRKRRDGTIGYHSFSANPVFEGDRVIGVEGFIVDSSDRKMAERDRQQTEQRYRSLFDSMQEGVAIHKLTRSNGNPDNYLLLEVNRRFEEIIGIRRDDAVGKLATTVYGIREAPFLKEYASVVETGTSIQFETYFQPMDKHFLISVARVGDDGFATIFFDITGQKKAEEGMRSLVTAIEQTGETIIITDPMGTIQYCNPAFEKITGYSKTEAIGQNPRILKSGKHTADFYRQMWTTITQGRVWVGRLTNQKKDGSLFEEDATISPIRDAAGKITGFVSVTRDVTERIQLEHQFRQAQKLESVGRLAGGVAHDFNNLLTVINGYSEFLLKRLKTPDPLRSYAQEIRTAGERAASLTKQLLAFSRNQVIEPSVVDLNATIRESAPMLQRLIGEDIILDTHLDDSLGQVMAGPDQINQVIMNLAVNARDAMPSGGKLDIETRNVDLVTKDNSAIHPEAVAGRYVLMVVTDTGHGIDEAICQHIFEPFFTTKEEGKGTGLGLSTVYGIVRQSGGWIDVWSEVGVGTSFRVYLPRVDASPVPERSPIRDVEEKGSATILVVEDQLAVRVLIKAVLQQHGYEVIEASDGDQAMAVAERHPGRIHLLLTDVVLPGMNGKELSGRLQKARPDLKVLLVSGYAPSVIVPGGAPVRGAAFLHKPFSPDELAAKVLEVLAGGSEPET